MVTKEKIIDTFDGGMVNDPRDKSSNVARVVANFDVFTNKHKMTPYRDSEDGDSGASTSKKQNFCLALRTGTTYSLYGLGVISGTAKAEVQYKDLTTGASNDLDDNGWATPTNNQSSTGATDFELFVYYQLADLIIGARAGTNLWAFSPSGSAWSDSWQSVTYTTVAQGLVNSKDDILYIPYDNKIATYNHTGTVFTAAALTLPQHLYITSICEKGNFIAIACAPKSGVGSSRVYLWNRDSSLTTLSENIDWGEGIIKILEEVDGVLLGITLSGGVSYRNYDRLTIRYYDGVAGAKKLMEFVAEDGSSKMPITKQKLDNRLYFGLKIKLNGAFRAGVWSIGRSANGQFTLVNERSVDNNLVFTSASGDAIKSFYIIGDYTLISYTSGGTYAMSKSNDSSSAYTATSYWESKIEDGEKPHIPKKLSRVTINTEPLPTAGQCVVKYKIDSETSYTTIMTNTTDNSVSKTAVNIESSGLQLPVYKEIQFRIESTGYAEPTRLRFVYEELTEELK